MPASTTIKNILLVIFWVLTATLLVILFGSPKFLFVVKQSPVDSDMYHFLIVKPGCTIRARSLDAEGTGGAYHFTRYGTYKAPRWRPKTK